MAKSKKSEPKKTPSGKTVTVDGVEFTKVKSTDSKFRKFNTETPEEERTFIGEFQGTKSTKNGKKTFVNHEFVEKSTGETVSIGDYHAVSEYLKDCKKGTLLMIVYKGTKGTGKKKFSHFDIFEAK